ncbi:energy transducer TonB [Oleiphilus sp. HI0086]|uniref:energy transducer TonB n=2 Tax=Oleiphilus sp. HI0086 TaxID=1822260 RepID=UPI0007C24AB5|nr:energy transducer TonB [Oleiphilus sp. HI0086]KZY50201.1 hypothetical protein A3732_04850 [Oleiphilus sp. HI0050]KZZ34500.1 hypothetical protein A3756_17735 [Oleiphilus sp. HI0086]
MTTSKPIRITVIVSVLVHCGMMLAVFLTVSGGVSLDTVNVDKPLLRPALVISHHHVAAKPKPKPKPEPEPEPKPENRSENEHFSFPSETVLQAQSLGLEGESILAYKQELFKLIEAQKFYPKRLKRMRREGEVTIEFTLLANGDLKVIKVIDSRGHKLFKQASLAALKKVDTFPPFPKESTRAEWTFTVALNYSLRM